MFNYAKLPLCLLYLKFNLFNKDPLQFNEHKQNTHVSKHPDKPAQSITTKKIVPN